MWRISFFFAKFLGSTSFFSSFYVNDVNKLSDYTLAGDLAALDYMKLFKLYCWRPIFVQQVQPPKIKHNEIIWRIYTTKLFGALRICGDSACLASILVSQGSFQVKVKECGSTMKECGSTLPLFPFFSALCQSLTIIFM